MTRVILLGVVRNVSYRGQIECDNEDSDFALLSTLKIRCCHGIKLTLYYWLDILRLKWSFTTRRWHSCNLLCGIDQSAWTTQSINSIDSIVPVMCCSDSFIVVDIVFVFSFAEPHKLSCLAANLDAHSSYTDGELDQLEEGRKVKKWWKPISLLTSIRLVIRLRNRIACSRDQESRWREG